MILIRGARQLLTLQGPPQRRGRQMADVSVIADGSVLVDGDKIIRVGPTRQVENVKEARRADVIEAHGKVVMPGFVDSCTQLMSGAPLFNEMEFASGRYGEWQRVIDTRPDHLLRHRSIRNISPNALRGAAKRWLGVAASSGTTSLEIRSGHGLHMLSELKALRAARALDGEPLDIQAVALAGPSRGDDFPAPEQATAAVIDTLIPEIKRRKLSRYLAVDVDPAVFGAEGLNRILEVARDTKLRVKLQAGKADANIIPMALEMGAVGIDHLTSVCTEEISALAGSNVVATLLPAISHQQGGPFAPARDLITAGVAVALASGFGAAGGPTINMATVMSLACARMELSPAEAIIATTVNGAAALGRASKVGMLEPDKQADIAIFDVGDYREIPYYLGMNLCVLTMKKGRVIHSARTLGLREAPRLAPRQVDPAIGRDPLPRDSALRSRP